MKLAALCLTLGCAVASNALSATETIPPSPAHYFNDYAGIISQSAAEQFDRKLRQFEIETSDQVVVAIFPKMESDDDVAAYAQRVAQSWAVGQKDKRNGVVLFVFVADRTTSIQVGYGLEGALPDITAYDIRANHISPHFRDGDYEGGLAEGIDAIFKAIRGEYKPNTAATAEPSRHRSSKVPLLFGILFVVLSFLAGIHRTGSPGHVYSSAGRHWTFSWSDFFFFWLSLILSGSSRGGSSSSSSGGGFSGGGGSFGGGGSSGSW